MNRAGQARRIPNELSPPVQAQDIGDINVLQDEGDLILKPSPFDLTGVGLQFVPNGSGGYEVSHIDATFRQTLGNALGLGDDDSFQTTMPFRFSLFGKSATDVFVNSDGNLTFEGEDRSSTDRNVTRFLTGPPRVSPFLADLDPTSGGRVFLQSAGDQFTVTWCGVKGFASALTATVQVSLLPNGHVEMKYAPNMSLRAAVVGVSPGRTANFTPVDLSASGILDGGGFAVGERFGVTLELDLVAAARKFYATHGDLYDQLLFWTDTPLTIFAFSFEITIANEISGIGVDRYDLSRDYGSGGRLRSIVMMDALSKFPDDPAQKFLGENNALSIIGQEAGHRWLAFMPFRDVNGQTSNALLGRDLAHWSFFFDSDASVMEGNDIADLGGGAFRTVGAVNRYSMLDQYAMGLVRDIDVPPFFYVESPTNSTPFEEPASGPRIGVTFNGTRRTVLIQDVIAVLGPRQPSSEQASKTHRQAFIYVISQGRTADAGQLGKLDRFRVGWTSFFSQGTDGRGTAETRLRASS